MLVPIPNKFDSTQGSTSQKRTLDQDIDDADMVTDEQPLSKYRRIDYGSQTFPLPISDESSGSYSSTMTRATLANLPNDILLLIFANVDVNDILALRMVSEPLHTLSFPAVHS